MMAPIIAAMIASSEGSPAPTAATSTLDSEEQLFLNLINQYRQENGLGVLATNTQLQNATGWMSADMGINNYFSHCDMQGLGPAPNPCPDPCLNPCRDPFQRMSDFGYNYNVWKGENIAAGTSSAQLAFDLWKASAGHNANMLSANYTVTGIDRSYTASSAFGWYWTNDFGGYDPNPLPLDSDQDGFSDTAELHVGTGPADPCGNNGWPADLSPDNTLNISDFNTFILPLRSDGSFNKFGHPVPDPHDAAIIRWDLDANNIISIGDLNALNPGTLASTARPPMLGGQPAFFTNAGQCPFPP